ncbi:trifunctional transcriptional regulator/proline dehydrogenase/L-glutamate gamma-semialdehyde dehydrogenase [Ralstonia solanacearum]|uniref:trifunctional transcriptional regulator/proline dehydrogenase/L-glutamate gamma-semialdehyde dehydrogenase n=1 Tax=Ralstonia solanacearum TaxID=305 RepID=UPI001B3B38B7|nr:trifunctional transcriptional regulator/proline dehydrogenase/L-glutamate gamma-semialdehyde dehydrogenase [Ralstonia solanacearum]AST33694.2 trifunctional transcriptional regulator/proline dehydrogenase/L-glutamate gamma-semialdehyde dehydrogenase [Ralstonia solanacearum]MDB0510476.1 trifunctional transcriptional regulator/proline dehydrogenase/L-glutamate gamma-semialdehyde dehydrogenase [Ralstonia solanacearum]MDB0514981.1 trifunctional transcriptional regulator/proline dehydrogenase/L-glu
MATTTLGVKLDDASRERLKRAAQSIDRTPHWLIKQAIFTYLDQVERGQLPNDISGPAADGLPSAAEAVADMADTNGAGAGAEAAVQPFLEFAQSVQPQSVLRAAITAAYRRPETEAIPMLLEQARLPGALSAEARQLARDLAGKLRSQKVGTGREGLVQGLIQEFSLSSQEGVALMCLAEALLRIPDKPTRDALIRDKISNGNWQSHLGQSPSLFVNAATWGLLLTGKLVATHNEAGLSKALTRIIGKRGEPLIRKGVDMAMRLMGEQFVTGETISEALANARKYEAEGFRYSYDMLGEAAMTEADAQRYLASYEQAIRAIGQASGGRGIYEGPGISIKLSALHPRYARAQYDRTLNELYPRVKGLAMLAREYDIGINIDAEEADRLELSLDLLERLCFAPELAGWNGLGFVVQGYQKRCPFVLDYIIDLARRSKHRLMIRLVKGAYWDSEVKRAQVDGLEGYPVYTRKVYTDVSYLACARKLLAAPDAVFPQFATHNAHTLAAIYHMAGQNYYPGQYEFQCLHGMGEPLYEQVVGGKPGKLNRPCRIYAPVGTHETLLAYLVRRLLENGANTSFVNRIADESIPLDALVADPVAVVETMHAEEGTLGLPHPKIPLPRQLYGDVRANSSGIDLANEQRLASLSSALLASTSMAWAAAPTIGDAPYAGGTPQPVRNPADLRDVVGHVTEATPADVDAALTAAAAAAPIWQATPPEARAALLERAADLMEGQMQSLMGLIIREAGKTLPNAISEVREAVDFLRYYAAQVRGGFSNDTHRPLGPVVCISPWNFPLAIFTGQVSAALAAGNPVLAKPAEQTPLIAAQAVRILREAGVPAGAVQLLPGRGETVGAALVRDARTKGVMFTGSTEVARILQRTLAGRLDANGAPIPLIAETGGQNAMIVDSSALAEQVVADVLSSAFDSAGQRCSALRVLCLQDDVADRVLAMLKGGMAELAMGNPDRLATDVGPVIDAEARDSIAGHIDAMRAKGRRVHQAPVHASVPAACAHGTFVPPTVIELDSLSDLTREIFGPVLHVVRWKRTAKDTDGAGLTRLIEQINGTGYGLTLGIHTRIDETIAHIVERAHVGNLYVNRNIVGAVVGVQPFGGEGLSGTGPKAGGPLYLLRLLSTCPQDAMRAALALTAGAGTDIETDERRALLAPFDALHDWARKQSPELAAQCDRLAVATATGAVLTLPGPTGERNTYMLLPRDAVLCVAADPADWLRQLAAVLAVGSEAVVQENPAIAEVLRALPSAVQSRVRVVASQEDAAFDAVLHHGDSDHLRALCEGLARRTGPIVGVQGLPHGGQGLALERLLIERSLSVNTAAAGGNASLMTIG